MKRLFLAATATIAMLGCGDGGSSATLKAPTGLAAMLSSSTVKLSWVPGGTNQDMFMVMKKVAPSTSYDTSYNTPGTATSYEDAEVTSGKTYTYMVMAMKGSDGSPGSNEVTVSVP
jgi:hypothetical protein